jgi:hypothetical protein
MESGWARVARYIREAAAGRYSTHGEFAVAASLSVRTIEDLTAGRRTRYSTTTIYRVESALRWQHGSIQRIAEGGSPIIEEDADLAVVRDAWPQMSRRDRRAVLALIASLRRR